MAARSPWPLGAEMLLVSSFYLSLSPLIPAMADTFDARLAVVGRAAAAYAACFGLVTFVQALVADRLPARAWIIPALCVHALAISSAAVSPSISVLLLAYAAAGAAAGILQPSIYRLALEDADHKAQRLAHLTAGWAIAVIGGAPVLAACADLVGWRAPLLFLAAAWVPVFLGLRPLLDPSCRVAHRHEDLRVRPRQALIYASTILTGASFHGVFTFLGAALGLATSPIAAPLAVSLFGCGAVLASISLKRITAPIPALYVSMGVASVAVITLPYTLEKAGVALACLLIWGSAQTLVFSLLALMLSNVTSDGLGKAMGFSGASMMLGASAGTFVAAGVFSSWGFGPLALVSGALTFLAAIPVALLKPSHSRTAQ
jgi:MFS transporter, DHA1 family, inner membrane transport protein